MPSYPQSNKREKERKKSAVRNIKNNNKGKMQIHFHNELISVFFFCFLLFG